MARFGGFTADWSIWCAAANPEAPATQASDCPTWEHVEGKRSKTREKDAKARGWRRVARLGWLCPPCYSLRKSQGD